MSRIVLVTNSEELADRVGYAANEPVGRIPGEPFPINAMQLLGMLGGAVPEVLILHRQTEAGSVLGLISQLDQEFDVSVVLATADGAQVVLSAVHAGAVDVVSPDADVAQLRQAIQRAEQQARGRKALKQTQRPANAEKETGSGRVIAVASPKGGVGKTTVCTNLALGIALRDPGSVVLVDLDIHFGDVGHSLALTPEYTLVDTVRAAMADDAVAVKSLLTHHKSGLFVVTGSESPVAADAITAAEASRLLRMLSSQFKYVVVDTAPGLSEHTLAALDQATDLVMVTSLDVPSVRGLRKELDTLRQLGMLIEPRHVVLNFNHESRGLSVRDVEVTIKEPVEIVIPLDTVVPQSVNRGTPLVGEGGRDSTTRQFQRLVDAVVPPAGDQQKRGFFDKLGRRG